VADWRYCRNGRSPSYISQSVNQTNQEIKTMPKFQCLLRQDAVIFWSADIEAENAEQASREMLRAWNGERDDIELLSDFQAEGYDHADCDPEDCQPDPMPKKP
jgi:hypothetical protein